MKLNRREKKELRFWLLFVINDATHPDSLGGSVDSSGACGLRRESKQYKILSKIIKKIEHDLNKSLD